MNNAADDFAEALEARFGRIADEFTDRLNRGERPDVEEYVRRYPEMAEVLREGLPILQTMRKPAADYGGRDAPSPSSRPLPERLGEYRVLREIGRGGMGAVYEAVQEPLGRSVALKVLPFHGLMDVLHLQRFRREAKAAARLHHTNIVPVFGVGEQDGVHFYAMQFIEGRTLTCVQVPDASHQFAAIARWGLQVAEALAYAHGQGVLHRDIKPTNLLLDRQGTVWVTDFGLARAEGLPDLTRTGDLVGTLRYMAPEQLDGRADARSDLYSLGLTLYELVTGRPAFDAADRNHLVKQVMQDEPPRPRQLNRSIPRDLETILVKATAKEPGRRYASGAELADDLRLFLEGRPIRARRLRPWEHAWRWARRRRALAALAALSLVLFLVGFGAVTWQWRRAEAERVVADEQRDEADRQRVRAQHHYEKSLEAVDRMLTRVGYVQLAWVPQMELPRRKLLEDALEFYQGFLHDEGQDPAIRLEVARAYERIGEIYNRLGQADEADRASRQATAVLEALVAEFPDRPGYRHQLANCLNLQGKVADDGGKPREAEVFWKRVVATEEGLLQEAPSDFVYRKQLAAACHNLGRSGRNDGRLAEAEGFLTRAIGLYDELLREQPGHAENTLTLASTWNLLGLVYGAQGRGPQAVDAYRKAAGINEEGLRREPGNPEIEKDLARVYNNLGLAYYRERDYTEAIRCYERALPLHERAYRDFPRVVIFAINLAGTYTNRGDVARSEKQVEEALAWYGRAAEVLERATAQDPRHAMVRYNLFNLSFSRAMALRDLGRKEDAAREWKRAVEVSEGQSHILMRLYRPPALARLGEHARAAAEADALVADGKTEGTNLYNFAYTHALGVAAARQDARLTPAEQAQLADRYGARAVELLTMARAAGFFRQRGKLEHLHTDKDMDAVRPRPDFQRLLAELDAQAAPKAK